MSKGLSLISLMLDTILATIMDYLQEQLVHHNPGADASLYVLAWNVCETKFNT